MAVIETWLMQDLKKPVPVQQLCGNFFSHNGNANRIGVRVYNGDSPATLSGTVSGYAVLTDGTTVPCTGSLSGNEASILLPAAAYVPGNIFITIMLTSGTTITTLAALAGNVVRARTDSQVDPGSVVTDWTNTINAALQTVENYTGNIIATPYASLTYPVPLGKYCIYNNLLYRCVSPIASSENWTASHWTQTKLADDVSDLKSAFKATLDNDGYNVTLSLTSGRYVKLADGKTSASTAWSYSDYFNVVPGGKLIYTCPTSSNATQIENVASVAFYSEKAENAFISPGIPLQSGTTGGLKLFVVDVPQNAVAAKASVFNNSASGYFVYALHNIETLDLNYIDSTIIPANSNFNNYIVPGNYRVMNTSVANTILNIPVKKPGRLIVFSMVGEGSLVHIYIATNGSIFSRSNENDSWGAWDGVDEVKKIIENDDIIVKTRMAFSNSRYNFGASCMLIALKKSEIEFGVTNNNPNFTNPWEAAWNAYYWLMNNPDYLIATNCNFSGAETTQEVETKHYPMRYNGVDYPKVGDVVTRAFFALNPDTQTFQYYPIGTNIDDIPASYTFAFACGDLLINNGVIVSDLSSSRDNGRPAPRNVFGWDNDYYYIFFCEGRNDKDAGFTLPELQDVLLNRFNVQNAVNMDGGGSVCVAVNMPVTTKVNNYIDAIIPRPTSLNLNYKFKSGNKKINLRSVDSINAYMNNTKKAVPADLRRLLGQMMGDGRTVGYVFYPYEPVDPNNPHAGYYRLDIIPAPEESESQDE